MLEAKKDTPQVQIKKNNQCDELSKRIQHLAKKIDSQCENLLSEAPIKQSLQEMIATCESALVELDNQQLVYKQALQQRKESLISKILKR